MRVGSKLHAILGLGLHQKASYQELDYTLPDVPVSVLEVLVDAACKSRGLGDFYDVGTALEGDVTDGLLAIAQFLDKLPHNLVVMFPHVDDPLLK